MSSWPVCDAVVFDLDGTLLDAEPIYYEAYANAAAAVGKSYSVEIHSHIIGRPDSFGVGFVANAIGTSPDVYRELRDVEIEKLMPTVRPHPGAVDVVKSFKDKGLPVAIATSSQKSHVDIKRETNPELFALVDAVVFGDDPRIKAGKPEPYIFLAAAEELGIPPTRCWAFEDAPAGVQSAKTAGMFVFAIPDSRLDRDQYARADVLLERIADFRFPCPPG